MNSIENEIELVKYSSIPVHDSYMHYVETGTGDPIVFLHGNPTSSYLWRNIIPYVKDCGRCLAPDLIGMGKSGKPNLDDYGFATQFYYLNEWFMQMNLKKKVTLVIHDWGSALGFHWAYKNQDKVKAIVFMEAIVQPRIWSDFPEGRDKLFKLLKSDAGEEMVYEHNFFVETVLPKSILRTLTVKEMDRYRAPFINKNSRKPTLDLARELPIEGEPAAIAKIVDDYGQWMAESTIPKLMIVAEPGALLVGRNLEYARSWHNLQEVKVSGSHYIQEDAPNEIGEAIRTFYLNI